MSKGAVVDSSVNGLLAALPETSRERLFAKTQLVSLSVGDILYHPGAPSPRCISRSRVSFP